MNELISIIVPVYNVSNYLPVCLNSLVSQTWSNLEIILVDDGSTDQSREICAAWAEKDERIRVIHQKNAGVSAARNQALRLCTGHFIGFMDADDRCESEMFQSLAEIIIREHADAAACGYVDYPYGPEIPVEKGMIPMDTCGFEDAVFAMMRRNGYFTAIWNKLFRREVVFPNGMPILMDETLSFGEDEVWLLEVLRKCNKVAFIPRAMYYWQLHPGSLTRTPEVTPEQMSVLRAKQQTLNLLPNQEPLSTLVKGRIFNDCYILKVNSYCNRDREKYQTISGILRPFKKYWWKSNNFPLLRKGKVQVMELGMMLHAPAWLIQYLNHLQWK